MEVHRESSRWVGGYVKETLYHRSMLFILVSEVISLLMNKGKQVGIIKGVSIGDMELTHIHFADDTVFFLKNDWESIKGIKKF